MNVLQSAKRFRFLLVALVAVVAVGLAACGDDDATSPPTEPPDISTSIAVDDDADQLKIGYLADFSGPLAEFGPVIQTGVELAIKHINDAGGVNGQDVVFVTGDTGLDSTKAVEEARRLVEIEGVHAIVGPLSSTITIAVAESVTGDAGVPTISPSATSPGVTDANDNGYLFRSTTSDAAQGPVLAQLAADEGIDNVGVLFINDAYGQGLSDAFEAAFTGTLASASYEDGAASYLAELQQVAGGGAEVLVAIGFPTQAQVFIREALENDVFSRFLFVDGTKSQDLIDDIGGDFLNGSKGTARSAPKPTHSPRGMRRTKRSSARCRRCRSCARRTTPRSRSRWPPSRPAPSRARSFATRWCRSRRPAARSSSPERRASPPVSTPRATATTSTTRARRRRSTGTLPAT